MNRDKGPFELPHILDSVVPTINLEGGPRRSSSNIAATVHQVAAVLKMMADLVVETVNQ